jgi:threonine/homoserine/homoserine lactone efflux protein
VLAVTAGPGIFYVAARTLFGGRGEGMASSLGTGLGGMVHVLAGSVGVSAIVLTSAELFTALKLLGAVYLVWLGLRALRAARRDAMAALQVPSVGAGRAFREGVLVEALNPKTAAFFLSASSRLPSTPSRTCWWLSSRAVRVRRPLRVRVWSDASVKCRALP